jgi:hypothetical protein
MSRLVDSPNPLEQTGSAETGSIMKPPYWPSTCKFRPNLGLEQSTPAFAGGIMEARGQCLGLAACLWVCGAIQATAEPITAFYTVHVYERFYSTQNQTGPFGPEPFDAQFELALTFDPALSTGSTSYGPAFFSPGILDIPLPRPAVPEGLEFRGDSGTTHLSTIAAAGESLDGFTSPDWFVAGFHASLGLEGRPGLPPSVEAFPSHLTMHPGFPSFLYSACAVFNRSPENRCQGGRFESVTYYGTLTLNGVAPAPPVPEPATIALVAGGLVMLAKYRRGNPRLHP